MAAKKPAPKKAVGAKPAVNAASNAKKPAGKPSAKKPAPAKKAQVAAPQGQESRKPAPTQKPAAGKNQNSAQGMAGPGKAGAQVKPQQPGQKPKPAAKKPVVKKRK